jgi:Putative auto-transporter adhesin, head GIN domain
MSLSTRDRQHLYLIKTLIKMNKLLIAAVYLLCITATGFTSRDEKKDNSSKTATKSIIAYQSLVINDDIDVVLTEADSTNISVTGTLKDIQSVSHFTKKGVLYVHSKKGSLRGKVTVHLSVNNLKQVEINGMSSVTSNGTLNSRKLKVRVNGEAIVHLKTFGKFVVEGDERFDLHFEKWNNWTEIVKPKVNSNAAGHSDAAMDELFIQSHY